MSGNVEIRLCAEDEIEESWALERKVWAPFNWEAQGAVGVDYFPELHLVAVSQGKLVGTIDGCPLDWDGDPSHLPLSGWTGMIEAARQGFEGLSPRWVGAIGTSIDPDFEGGGLAGRLLVALRDAALALGYVGVAAPVRPVARWRMPQVSLEEYAALRLPDMRHFDPWVRVHERIGGRIVAVCEQSANFVGDREDWERWLGMRLPDDGRVLAAPAAIDFLDLFQGVGILTEGSIWMVHSPQETKTLIGGAEVEVTPETGSVGKALDVYGVVTGNGEALELGVIEPALREVLGETTKSRRSAGRSASTQVRRARQHQ